MSDVRIAGALVLCWAMAAPAGAGAQAPTSQPATRPADKHPCCQWIDALMKAGGKRPASMPTSCPTSQPATCPKPLVVLEKQRPFKRLRPPPDLLSMSEAFTLELGTTGFSLDSYALSEEGAEEETDTRVLAETSVAGTYSRSLETLRYGLDTYVNLSVGPFYRHDATTEEGTEDTDTFLLDISHSAAVTFRYYPFAPRNRLFAFAGSTLEYELQYGSDERVQDAEKEEWDSHSLKVSLTAGLGYGRLLYKASSWRLRLMEDYLRRRRFIAGPIPTALADGILLRWYQLRNELTFTRHVSHLVRQLAQAGLLVRPLTVEAIIALNNAFTTMWYLYHYTGWSASAGFQILGFVTSGGFGSAYSAPDGNELDHELLRTGAYAKFHYCKEISIRSSTRVQSLLYVDPAVKDTPFAWLLFDLFAAYAYDFISDRLEYQGTLSVSAGASVRKAFGKDPEYYVMRYLPGHNAPGGYSYSSYLDPSFGDDKTDFHADVGLGYSCNVTRRVKLSASVRASVSRASYTSSSTGAPQSMFVYKLSATVGLRVGMLDGTFSRY